MAKPTLRAVGADEKAAADPPSSLVEAAGRDRRSLLVRSRLEIAQTIDAGVPAHALARLISELDRIDSDIRRLDARQREEVADGGTADDEAFDASAL
jgi:hypothetical protein